MQADPIAPLLAGGHPLVLDGGLATQLEAQGADLSDSLWSARLLVDDPDLLIAGCAPYVDLEGSDGVLLGRAWSYALAAGGEAGISKMLSLIEAEMRVALSLTGVTRISEINQTILAEGERR